MCGLVGWLGSAGTTEMLPAVRSALARLAHRGPDGSGLLVFSPAEGLAYVKDGSGTRVPLITRRDGGRAEASLAAARDAERVRIGPHDSFSGTGAGGGASLVLGHNRLAILDPTPAAAQPMASADGRHVLAFNGEIYNYVELRSELEGRGHLFRSRSDTEVLLAALREWGRDALPRLVGMFALAFLDAERGRLLLARDPFGIKPLYLARTQAGLFIGSEIPALLTFPGVRRAVRPQALLDFVNDGLTDHGAATMLADVESLHAARWVEIDLERPEREAGGRYWEPDFRAADAPPFDEAAQRLRELFLRSVEIHLRSYVRVGTMLSGGIDSSAIVMAMREVGGKKIDIHTFSYVGEQGAVSEEHWIDRVNEAAGAVAHNVRLRAADVARDLDALVASQAEPFGGPAVSAQRRVFREAAAAGVKVILDGQGADELLGGYSSVWPDHLASLLRRGRWRRAARFLEGVASRDGSGAPGAWATLRNGLTRIDPDLRDAALRIRGARIRPWVSRSWCSRHGLAPSGWRKPDGAGPLHSALWRSVRQRSLPGLLRYEDRSSMAFSLEARLPFLTPEIASFALSLPEEHLIAPDATGKSVFRAAMRGIVPDAVLDRREKIGFAVPNRTWLALFPRAASLLEEARAIPAIDADYVAPVQHALRSGHPLPESESFLVWRLILLALWRQRFEVEIPGR